MQFIDVNNELESNKLIEELKRNFYDYNVKKVNFSSNIITLRKDFILIIIDIKTSKVSVVGKINRQYLGYIVPFCFFALFGGFPALIFHLIINNKKKKEFKELENKIISFLKTNF